MAETALAVSDDARFPHAVATLCCMAALTRLKLSSAYPAMSLNFVIPVLLSGWLLHEDMTARRIAGIGLIVLGTLHATR